MCLILHAGPSCWAWWWQGALFLPCMGFSDCQTLHKGRADVTSLFLLFPLVEQGVNGAAAPPSIACQHSWASEGSGKLSTKKSVLTQYTSSHKGLVPFHPFPLALQLRSALCVGLVSECLYYLLSVVLLNPEGLLMVCNVKDVCRSLQSQSLQGSGMLHIVGLCCVIFYKYNLSWRTEESMVPRKHQIIWNVSTFMRRPW